MEITQSNKALDVLRWIGFLPAALLAAWLAWILINVLGRLSLSWAGVDPEGFQGKLQSMVVGHTAMGAVFVYVGAKIAPYHKVVVAFILGGIGIVMAGFLLFPAVMTKNWWAVGGGLFVAIGAGLVIYTVHTGETDL